MPIRDLNGPAHARSQTVTVNGGGKAQKASLRRALRGAKEEKAEEAALRSAKVQRALAMAQLPDCNCL